MPRISAPTVAEHRALQRDALLHAARDLLVDQGADAVTPARLGEATGLARNSVYTYFPSSGAVLAELVEDGFRRWAVAIDTALVGATDPVDRLERYVSSTLIQAAAGEHRVAVELANVALPDACRERVGELHRQLEVTLHAIIESLGVRDADNAMVLVQGTIDGALRAADRGAPVERLTAITLQYVLAGLTVFGSK